MFSSQNERTKNNYVHLINALKLANYEEQVLLESKDYKIGKKISIIRSLSLFKLIKKFSRKTMDGLENKIKYKNDDFIDIHGENHLKNINYFSKNKIAVYTCITGNYDNLIEPAFFPDNCDFYVITNHKIPKYSIWKKINIDYYHLPNHLSNIEINRYFKMLPQLVFKHYKYSVYIDGNIKLSTDPTEFVNRISTKGMAFFRHSERNSVYREAAACVASKKADKDEVGDWVKFLRNQKMPEDYGLVQCSVIARDHSSQIMRKVMKEWWNLFYKGKVKRDQLLLPYVLMKNNISVDDVCTLGGNVWTYPGLQTVEHN